MQHGIGNTAVGAYALDATLIASNNTAVGSYALRGNTGGGNVALGHEAGLNQTTGSRNIYIGDNVRGVAGETEAIYLGLVGTQTKTVIAGIRGTTTGAADAVTVLIDSNGQLGTVSSSRRFKDGIRDMGDASVGLMALRPVTFRYREAYTDGTTPVEYGLIAEEVAEVYPDLVVNDRAGHAETVQYRKVNAMLLNEVQKQHRQIQDLLARVAQLERQTN